MASLFDGLQTQASEATEPAAASANGGGNLFGSLSVGGSGEHAGSADGPSSAFSFVAGGASPPLEEAQNSPSAPAAGGSMFSFMNSSDSVREAPVEDQVAGDGTRADVGSNGNGGSPPSPFGGSAFSFMTSGAHAEPAAPSTGGSAFSFMSSSAQAEPAAPSTGGGFSFVSGGAQAESTATSTGGAFSFISSGAQPEPAAPSTGGAFSFVSGSAQADLAAPPTGEVLPPVETGPRKKTRKAILPGQATRSTEPASVPPPPPEPSLPTLAAAASESHPSTSSSSPTSPAQQTTAAESTPSNPAPIPEDPKPAPPPETSKPAPYESSKPPPPTEPSKPSPPVEVAKPLHDSNSFKPPPPPAQVPERTAEEVRAADISSRSEHIPAQSGFSFIPDSRAAPVQTAIHAATSSKPPPPVEPALSPSQKLERVTDVCGVREWMRDRAAECDRNQRRLLEEQMSCLSARQRTTENIASLRQRLEQTEAEQNSLCDKEQFEEAGALDVAIQELKDAISKQLEEVSLGSQQMESLAKSLLDLARGRQSVACEALTRAEDLQQEGRDALSNAEERNDRRLASEQMRIESERKRINLAKSHIEKDSGNFQEEWQQVNDAIDQQTTEHVKERDDAAQARATLDEEISELQKQLEKKLEQRKTLSEVVDSSEVRIGSIRSKFEKQLTRLESKQKRLEEAQREVEADAQQVAQMELDLDKEREALREHTQQHKQQLRDIRTESRQLKRQRHCMARSVQLRQIWQRLLQPHQDSLNQARHQLEIVSRECVELSSSSENQEAEAAKLRRQVDAAVQALPGLEAEKKLAVASRSFKEAGRLTEEIRRREEDRKNFEAQLESIQSALTSAREALSKSRQGEHDAQAELLQTEARCALEELRVLRHQQRDLEELCRTPALSSSDRQLYEQETSVVQRQQEHLSKKYEIDLSSLADIPTETLEKLQAEFPVGSDDDVDEPDVSEEEEGVQIPNGSSEPAESQGAAIAATQSPQAAVCPASEAPLDRDALQHRLDELTARREALKTKEDAFEEQINKAVDEERFEAAGELEEERKMVADEISQCDEELARLKSALDRLPQDEDQLENKTHETQEEVQKNRSEEDKSDGDIEASDDAVVERAGVNQDELECKTEEEKGHEDVQVNDDAVAEQPSVQEEPQEDVQASSDKLVEQPSVQEEAREFKALEHSGTEDSPVSHDTEGER
eukprot:TRINITY_DN19148_c0_g1_i1.p1 TRINITY_DN19148_c0_g1~~TRINITY_DN19148_c0_g1_i1.p1  ORF type:complete len:1219 (+),score=325.67 TRINITY_DN19148_c0_g1_i1:54-3659(+)